MSNLLAIGDRTYSSWSLRGWLLFEKFGIPFKTTLLPLYSKDFRAALEAFAPARTVPAARLDGAVVWDSLALLETLAERFPKAGHWPADPADRALARSIVAEMHSGFWALRKKCPMNLGHGYAGLEITAELQDNLKRLATLWSSARARGHDGPWLFGDYTAVDAFFAPVAARIAGYRLPVAEPDQAYVAAHLAEPAFRRWRAMGNAAGDDPGVYKMDLPEFPWPAPAPLPAEPVQGLTPINGQCPYSGKPVAPDSLARIDGRVIGFCNPFCRDKSVADAAAWPALAPLLGADRPATAP